MTCDDLVELLTDFLEGELDEQQTDLAIAHLSTCPHCETVLSQTKLLIDTGREYGRVSLAQVHRSELLASILEAKKP
ncbi:MAG: anti-sigma factor [Acidimicrobiales bacterium]